MSFELQQTIKNNATQLKQYISDLYEWQNEMQLKQKAKTKSKQYENKLIQEQQFRLKKIQEEKAQAQRQKTQAVEKKKEMIRDVNTVQDYYKAWDKYDPDEDIKRLEQEQKRAYRPYNPYQDTKNNVIAKPQTRMTIKGTRNLNNIVKDPTSLKDKGNVHFKVCQYQKSIDCYSQCISKILNEQDISSQNNKKLLALVYSNRAMSYIKINQRGKALEDCNQSLKYDASYYKTYLRRADCYRKLGRYKQSLGDYRKVVELNPGEKQAVGEIRRIEEFMKKRIKETQEGMVVKDVPRVVPGGYRLEIQEVQEFQGDEELEEGGEVDGGRIGGKDVVNYLEEL